MKHGANIYKYAKKVGIKPYEIIDFSSNINFYRPKIKTDIKQETITTYAQSSYKQLRKNIASGYSINSSNIKLYNGATSAIYALFASIKAKRVYLYAPLYSEYEKAAKQHKKKIYKINRYKNIDAPIKKNSVVVFVNPSTPDGTYYRLDKLFNFWVKQNATIVLDESFIEFESLKSLRQQIYNYEKLYIIQSFSKFYSCAGIRIGAIFTNKKNISKIPAPLWNLSSFDVEFLAKRITDTKFKQKSQKLHKKNKKILKKILKHSKLFDTLKSTDANYILTHSKYSLELFEYLLKNKILVRECSSFEYLKNGWLRFAIKDKKSLKYLNKHLKKFYKTLQR